MSNLPKRQRLSFSQRVAQEISKGRSLFSAIFTSGWSSLGSFIGTYAATDPRNAAMRGTIARPVSARDLAVAQPYLRNLCRYHERNTAGVRAMTEGIVANVVGTGIDLEPDTGDAATDEKLREAWADYKRDCFIDGMGLFEGQTLAMRDVVVSGEAIWRFVIDTERSKKDRIPLCVLPLESEWLGDSGQQVIGMTDGYVSGVRIDKFGRAVSYTLYSPGGMSEEVPADKIAHIFERRRALQIRGEPWFAPILTTIKQESDLVTAELEAAKNTAGFAAAITSNGGLPTELDEKGEAVRNIQLGSILELQQGEDIKVINHTRPSQQIAPFRDMLRGDMAGALRIGRRWIDRDISGANYSSMRADMLDNDRLLGPVREWFGHQTVGRLYKAVLPYLALKAGVALPKRDTYRLVPDGQPYVDPLKDAQAAAMAIEFGLSTFEQEIGKRGGDYKQVWKKLAEEKAMLDKLGIVLHSPSGVPFGDDAAMAAGDDNTSGRPSKPGSKGQGGKYAGDAENAKQGDTNKDASKSRSAGDVFIRELAAKLPIAFHTHNHIAGTTVRNEIPAQPAPVVTVTQPPVQVDNHITVQEREQPAQPAPVVNVQVNPTPVEVEVTNTVSPTPVEVEVTNNVSPTPVTVENTVEVPQRTIIAKPNRDGSVTMTPQG